MNRLGVIEILLFVTLIGCSYDVTTVVRRGGPISLRDGIFVEFQSDGAGLAAVFRAELKDAGFSVVETKAEAVYLLSGSYEAGKDLFYNTLRFGQFSVTEIKTGQVVMLLDGGGTGVSSARTSVHKLVTEMALKNR